MNYFFSQLTRSIGVFFRTIRAFLSRKLMGFTTMLRRMTNFSRHATKVASSSLQGVVTAAQNPSKPADYVETGRLFISKALIIRLALGLVALGLIVYFLVWPFVLSRFMTARFYREDQRLEEWSGRVIVYSDEKKTVPLYSGRLEKGVLQGDAKLYQDGVIIYEGNLRDGQYGGYGKEYENGVLIYEGMFEQGLYDGRGKRYIGGELVYEGQFSEGQCTGYGMAYESGKLRYEGQFSAGLYEGRGKLYENEKLCYEGNFQEGVQDGYGTSYYPSGQISYQGQYVAGKREGSGVVYAEDGRKVYSGSFAEGEYDGSGTVFYADGGQLEATFQNGKPTGSADWKKNGLLYYQGECADGVPSGFGAVYSKAGKKLYEGPFLGGALDGASLLTETTEALRDALSGSSVKNESGDTVFRIIAEELGLTAECTYQTEDADSHIYRITLSKPEKGGWVELLPVTDHIRPVRWPKGITPEQTTIEYESRPGVNLPSGTYYRETSVADNQRTTVLYADESREKAVLMTWERTDVTPQALGASGDDGDGAKVEKLLKAMDKMIESQGTAASAGAYFNGKNSSGAFAQVENATQAVALAGAMMDYWDQSQRLDALQEVYDRNEQLLEEARDAAARGVGAPENATALEQAQLGLQARIDACQTAMKRSELQASGTGANDLGDYALEEMLVSFDPTQQDVAALAALASEYAKAGANDLDEASARTAVLESLLNLADAHSAVKLAQAQYEAAAAKAQSAAEDYSMGLGTKVAWYEAMNAETLSRIELCSALARFSKQANDFNQLTGGWVSHTFNWHNDVFGPLFEAAIPTEEEPENGEGEAPAEGGEGETPAESGGDATAGLGDSHEEGGADQLSVVWRG